MPRAYADHCGNLVSSVLGIQGQIMHDIMRRNSFPHVSTCFHILQTDKRVQLSGSLTCRRTSVWLVPMVSPDASALSGVPFLSFLVWWMKPQLTQKYQKSETKIKFQWWDVVPVRVLEAAPNRQAESSWGLACGRVWTAQSAKRLMVLASTPQPFHPITCPLSKYYRSRTHKNETPNPHEQILGKSKKSEFLFPSIRQTSCQVPPTMQYISNTLAIHAEISSLCVVQNQWGKRPFRIPKSVTSLRSPQFTLAKAVTMTLLHRSPQNLCQTLPTNWIKLLSNFT